MVWCPEFKSMEMQIRQYVMRLPNKSTPQIRQYVMRLPNKSTLHIRQYVTHFYAVNSANTMLNIVLMNEDYENHVLRENHYYAKLNYLIFHSLIKVVLYN